MCNSYSAESSLISNNDAIVKSIDNMILDINDTRITDAINSNKYSLNTRYNKKTIKQHIKKLI